MSLANYRLNVDRRDALLGNVISLAAVGASILLFGSGGGDDSHITWWVVDELRRSGHFHNFNGISLEQSSSLALVLITSAVRLFVPLPTAAVGVVLSLVALFGSCWMTGRVARRFDRRLAVPAVLLVATSGPLAYWSTSGMETALAAFSSVWLSSALDSCVQLVAARSLERASKRLCFECFLASALFASVRPENPLALSCLLLACAALCTFSMRAGQPHRRRAMARTLSLPLSCALLPIVLLFAWRRLVFREWFPHPVAAKSGGGARWGSGSEYLLHHMADFQPALLVLLPVAVGIVWLAFWRRRMKLSAAAIATLGAIGLLFICASGGDWMSCGRFLAPYIPIWWLTVLIAAGLALRRRPTFFRPFVGVLAAANAWFFWGLVTGGGANGYPLTAALKVVPAAQKQYGLESYPLLELANKSHLRDALLSEELKRVITRIRPKIGRDIWLASGQAGGVPYHVFSAFPSGLRFIDFWGLTTTEVLPCLPVSKLKHSSLGVATTPELLFEYREQILRDCHVPLADVVFNTSLRAGTRKGLEARGYRVIYFQRGPMPSFAQPSSFRGGTSMDAYIAVRRELADGLGLPYREVRWTLPG